eukprot:86819_1
MGSNVAHAIAGCGAGFVSTVALYPLDVIKTRLQSNDGSKRNPSAHKYSSMRAACANIMRTEGIPGFFGGLTPSVVGSTIAWGCYFWFYSIFKEQIRASRNVERLTMPEVLVASLCGGIITSLLTNPIWVVKVNMQLQSQVNRRFSGPLDCALKIMKSDGIAGLYKGLVPALLSVSQGALQFMLYEELKHIVVWETGSEYNVMLDVQTILMSSLSKTFAVCCTYPLQVIKTRLQHMPPKGKERKYATFSSSISTMLRNEGVRGFYKGLSASILRVLPANCLTFVVYERLKVLLNDSNETNI